MILYVRRVTDSELQSLKADPAIMPTFVFEPDAQARGDLIDFDKAWQAVHFTLSGAEYYSDSPLGVLLSNGETVGVDLGYGPPWVISHPSLAAFHSALSALTDEDIRSRFDPKALVENDIYGFEDCMEYPAEALEYLMQGIPSLRKFAERCASTGASALAFIS